MISKEAIKDKAYELGFCKIGFTTADEFPRAAKSAADRGYPPVLNMIVQNGSPPENLMEGIKSIIVLAYDYSDIDFPENLTKHVGRTYLSRTFISRPGTPMRNRLDAFEAFLEKNEVPFEPDRIELMIRAAAQRAGVASFGKNNFAYVDGAGSLVTLYGYLSTWEFEPDEPAPDCECPPNCHLCIDACPTKAMDGPFHLDAWKCIIFNNTMRYTMEKQDEIPEELIEGIGQHIHGCDACQLACPKNIKVARSKPKVKDPFLEELSERFSLRDVLHMPEGYLEQWVLPVMHNYVHEPEVFQRNAAIAMGNSGDKSYIPDLEAELDHPDEKVRHYVSWALDKLRA